MGSYRVEVDWMFNGSDTPAANVDYYTELSSQLMAAGIDLQVTLFNRMYPYGFEVNHHQNNPSSS